MNSVTDDFRRDSQKSPAELEREIDTVRTELRKTLEALEHRLSPTDIVGNLVTRVRRDGGELAENLGQSVKENPLPALLTSVGIAWMMTTSGRHHHDHDGNGSTGRSARGALRESADRWGERYQHARERYQHARDSASESAHSARRHGKELATRMRHGSTRMRSGLEHVWHEQPLMLGVLGLAAGALAGAAFPPSEQEEEIFDSIRRRARKHAGKVMEDPAKRHEQGEQFGSGDGEPGEPGDGPWTPDERSNENRPTP